MVGRDKEFGEVVAALSDPDVAVTLVVGDAGIGKSRMVTEVMAASSTQLTLAGACFPLRTSLPLLAVVDAFDTRDPGARHALDRAARSLPATLQPHIAGVMPRTLPEGIQPAGEVRREQLFIACEAVLCRLAEERPVTLVVEDLHWADSETLDLLTYLAGARHSARLHLLVTCRTDETRLPRSVEEWLHLRQRSPGLREVRLGRLGAADVRRMVVALGVSDGADVERLAADVFARGEGNPFFTEQLVAAAADGDRVPEGLAKLLAARVRAVSTPAQDALTALAVLGRPVSVDALQLVSLQEDEVALAAVRELEAASLVVRDQGLLLPKHALLAEALLGELPGLPASYHGRVASALEVLDDPSTVPEIADHLRRACDEEAELRVVQIAAQRAWDLGAYADAARWYRRIGTLHARQPGSALALPEIEVMRRTIRALDLSGERRAATQIAEQGIVRFSEWPDLAERLELLSLCAHLVGVDDRVRGQRMIEQLLPLYDQLPPTIDHGRTLTWLAGLNTAQGETRTAYQHYSKALAITRAAGSADAESRVLGRMSGTLRELGDREAADRSASDALRLAAGSDDHEALLEALVVESDNRLKYTEYEAAVAAAEKGLNTVDEGFRGSFAALLLVCNAAEAYLALGRTDDVGRLVDTITDEPRRPDDENLVAYLRAGADLRRGDPIGARDWLLGSRAMMPKEGEFYRQHAEAVAEVLVWNARPSEALGVVVGAVELALGGTDSQHTGRLLSMGVRAAAELASSGRRQTAEKALARLNGLLKSMTLDPFADRTTLPRGAADAGQWEAEHSRAEGHHDPKSWMAAAHAWEGLTMPHDAAYCWWRAAEAHLAKGSARHAVRDALHAGHRLADGHAPLRAELHALASRAKIPIVAVGGLDGTHHGRLTAQETKVLRLVADGLTNGQIGTALFISPKTASVHVSRIIAKLGVANRTEAAAYAHRHNLVEP